MKEVEGVDVEEIGFGVGVAGRGVSATLGEQPLPQVRALALWVPCF